VARESDDRNDDHEDTMLKLPCLNDRMTNVSELARALAKSIVNEAMDAESRFQVRGWQSTQRPSRALATHERNYADASHPKTLMWLLLPRGRDRSLFQN
jgi:hypothetical protein